MAIPVGTAVGYLDLDYTKFSTKLNTAVSEANGLSMKMSSTIGSGFTTIGSKIASVGMALTTGFTVPLGLAASSSIKFGADFDKSMSSVKAVSGATTAEFNTMRQAAIAWGEKTVYTASQSAEALYYMGLAGWDANSSVAALGPVLNLAAAGNLNLGRTSDIVTDSMTALGVSATGYTNGINNAAHFTNALASAMSHSNTDVDQLGEAFKYVAPVAGALGYNISDLTLALGLMANVGVKSSQAGTGLRQALKNLITPANDTAAALMDKLNISLFDSNGKALGFKKVLDNLRKTFGGVNVDVEKMSDILENEGEDALLNYTNGLDLTMTEQEKLQDIIEIFGTRALPGVLGIINASDEQYNNLANAINNADKAFVQHGNDLMTYEEAVEKYGEELVNTSGAFQVLGAAEGQAMIQMDNLSGDWTRFTSALGTTQIEITDLVNGVLRQFVQRLTELVTWFNGLDDEQQKNILKWAGIIAAIGPVLLVFGKLISGIGSVITTFSQIGGAITKIKIGFSMLGVKLTNVVKGFKLAKAGFSGFAAEASPLGAALGSITLPMILIAALVAALIAAFVHLIKTNEDFRNKVTEIWDGVKAKFEEAGQKILDVINKLGFDFDSLGKAIKAAFDWFSQFVAPLFLAVFETISGVVSSFIDIWVGIFEIIGGLIIGFRDGDWSTFIQGIKDTVGGIFKIITTPFRFAFNLITQILGAFGLTWSDVWNGVTVFFIKIGESIVKTVTGIRDSVVKKWEDLKAKVLLTVMNLKLLLKTHWDNIKEKVNGIVTNIKVGVIKKWNDLKIKVSSTVENLKLLLKTHWGNIKENVVRIVTDIKDKVIDLYKKIKTKVVKTVTGMVKEVVDKFIELKTKAIQKVTDVKDGIIEKFKDIKDKFIDIGSNIVKGLWNGIKSGWDDLKTNVEKLTKGLVKSAKSALGIKSPSRVFRNDVGRWIPPGVAQGVEDSMPKAVDKIQSSFDKGLSQISGDVKIDNPLFNMIDVVKDTLDSATLWFDTIEERLRTIVDDMQTDLTNLFELGQITIGSDGTISGLVYDRPTSSIDSKNKEFEDSEKSVVNNYYYTFNSPKAINEIEASKRMKETQRDLAEGF